MPCIFSLERHLCQIGNASPDPQVLPAWGWAMWSVFDLQWRSLSIKIHGIGRWQGWLLASFAVVLKRSDKKPWNLLLAFQESCGKVVFVVVNMVSLYLIYSYYHLIPLLQDSKRHEWTGRMDTFASVTCKLFFHGACPRAVSAKSNILLNILAIQIHSPGCVCLTSPLCVQNADSPLHL